jgi:thiol-disulfide isomerase/thioredoxin
MELLLMAMILGGCVVSFIGGIWLLVIAFRQSLQWGLLSLCCIPIGPLVFATQHWRVAAKPFLLNLVGTLVLFGGVALIPDDPSLYEDPSFAELEASTAAPSRQEGRGAERDESSVRMLVFTASWCPACRQLERSGILEKFSAAHPQVDVERVDIDEQEERARKYGIRGIPTVVLTDPEGRVLARPRTAGSLQELQRALSLARQR